MSGTGSATREKEFTEQGIAEKFPNMDKKFPTC